MQVDPTEAMQIFASNNKPTAPAGILEDDQLPMTTMTIEDNNDDSNDKVGRKNNGDDNKPEYYDAMTATPIPVGRSTMGDAMAAMNTMGNAMSATGMTTTSAAPTTRCVEFCIHLMRQLVCKLKALDIGQTKTSNSKSDEPNKSVDLAFDHGAELLCFTMGISLDLGLLKTLKEALAKGMQISGERL